MRLGVHVVVSHWQKPRPYLGYDRKMQRVAVFEGGILPTFCSRWEPAQIPEWLLRIVGLVSRGSHR